MQVACGDRDSGSSSSSGGGGGGGMSKAQLLEDIFEVLEKDPDGKKFDKGGNSG